MRARSLSWSMLVFVVAACSASVSPDGGRPDGRVDGASDGTAPPDVPVPPPDVPVPPPDVPIPPPDVPTPPPDGSSSCGSNAECGRREYCAGTGCMTRGTCVTRPDACPAIYAPVCGCDGRTYGNVCEAAASGVRVAMAGECASTDGGVDGGVGCGSTVCAPGQACCTATSTCYDPRCLSCCMPPPPRRCFTNRDCAATEYCDSVTCGSPGSCSPRPTSCPRIYDPVCGCDLRTYPNACVAAVSGIGVSSRGECPAADAGTDSGVTCGAGTVCPGGQVCCAATGRCYDPACLSCCMPRPGVCSTNSDCAASEYCASSSCAGTGTCTARPTACPLLYDPVCGCDGTTYSNSCVAASRGVRVAARGACGTVTDSGVDPCAAILCAPGTVCCSSTGRCYDPRCLSCCM